jgi:CubicO group peptidase (beta-lactamase class C family)
MNASQIVRTSPHATGCARTCRAVPPGRPPSGLFAALASFALLASAAVVAQTKSPEVASAPARPAPTARQSAASPAQYAPIHNYVRQQLVATGAPSLAIAVFRDGHIDWQEGFGWADREHKLKATPDTVYSLASISKTFTATAVMKLAADHVIDVDRPIGDYLTDGKLKVRVGDPRDVTVRRVANHTAGLPFHVQFFYRNESYRRPPAAETIARYGNIVREPGDHFFYSNLGFGILSDLIEDQSHQHYSDYMRENVFSPLGLTRTSVGISAALRPYTAAGYNLDGSRLPEYDTDHPGASEIFSSAHDLIRFAAFHLKAHLPNQRPILGDATIDQMHVPSAIVDDTHGYAFGFETSTRAGYQVVSHGGGMPGVATQMLMIPAKGIAIVVLCNSMRSDLVDDVTDRIAALLLPDWKPDSGGIGFPKPDKAFIPTAQLVGKWSGHISRPEGDLSIVINMPADGAITAAVGDQAPVAISDALFKDGDFIGQVAALVNTKDTERYKYILYVNLHLKGKRLYGTVTALDHIGPSNKHFVAGLSYWTDLTLQ